ncbi:hypothetical protein FISHEDRAFT_71849 [Fistulina hepatica ATCC 64428]|uniref:VPS9 domain-containing protein n=1 Tax=Fistulina hepatica ATCC 64428 TaxID=1128425 RepID=A0A0D7AHD6_9AGAR|nr:hypothetical protein FISHEDRAFT_71849 [Fistulina hepatica ATCC 64428]
MDLQHRNPPLSSASREPGLKVPAPINSGTHEILATHPLLSPVTSTSSTNPGYVPYTPRAQRVASSSTTTHTTTTGTNGLNASTHALDQSADETRSKSILHLVNMKSVAQSELALELSSLGWHILEALVSNRSHSPEWDAVRQLLASDRAAILLPVESGHTTITPEYVRDHVVQMDDSEMTTMSGLRGSYDNESKTLTLYRWTSFPPQGVFLPTSLSSSYPQYTCSKHTASLPIPPAAPPPLPPRPTPSTGNRFAFAGLFGRASGGSTSPISSRAASPVPGEKDIPAVANVNKGLHIPAYTISRPIARVQVIKQIQKSIKAEATKFFSKDRVRGRWKWVGDRIGDFVMTFLGMDMSKGNSPEEGRLEDLNDFYKEMEDAVRAFLVAQTDNEKIESDATTNDDDDEVWARIMNDIERFISRMLYHRWNDLDESFSSRVAALNMLNLGLDELGVDVGSSDLSDDEAAEQENENRKRDMQEVVFSAGDALGKLEYEPAPADKCQVLVEAHRLIIDGLSKLPPIKLKPEPPAASKGMEVELQQSRPSSRRQTRKDTDKSSSQQKARQTSPFPVPVILEPGGNIISSSPDSISHPSVMKERPSSPSTSTAEVSVSPSPSREASPAPSTTSVTATPISSDVLLPLLIYSLIKANPPHVVSHLSYIQRWRGQALMSGEETFCLVNYLAAVEYLQGIDLEAHSLGTKVDGHGTPTPISLPKPPTPTTTPPLTPHLAQQTLRGLAGSANKVFTGVVDSFGILRTNLLPPTPHSGTVDGGPAPSWNMLRRDSTASYASRFSIPIPGIGGGGSVKGDEKEEEMTSVSVGSSKSRALDETRDESDVEDESDAEEGEDDEESDESGDELANDTRSIKSFESMMSRASRSGSRSRKSSTRPKPTQRKSLSDRLASVSSGLGIGHSSKTSLPSQNPYPDLCLAPPNERFLQCSADDLRLAEVGELLKEYRRLVEGIRSVGGFTDD